MKEVDEKTVKNDRVLTALRQAQGTAEEAARAGVITIESLNDQDENLREAEDVLESNEHMLDRSMHIMRGMTWSGMMYNMFTNDPNQKDVKCHASTSTVSSKHVSKQGNVQSHIHLSNGDNLGLTSSSKPPANEEERLEQSLLRSVNNLHDMSMCIGQQLDQHGDTTDRIDDKTTRVHEKTLNASLRASQMVHRSNRSAPVYDGTFQFINPDTGRYLSVQGDAVILLQHEDDSTYFHCFKRENTILGLQHVKSMKFIGISFLGYLKAVSGVFGRYEECHIELDGRPSGLFFLVPNWGSGGWLKRPDVVSTIPQQQPNNSPSSNRSTLGPGDDVGALTTVTSDILDKTDMITFHAVKN